MVFAETHRRWQNQQAERSPPVLGVAAVVAEAAEAVPRAAVAEVKAVSTAEAAPERNLAIYLVSIMARWRHLLRAPPHADRRELFLVAHPLPPR